MPAWTRNSIKKKAVVLKGTVGATSTTDSDPAGWAEAAAADTQIGFLSVEKIDSDTTMYVYRMQGSRPDLLMSLDSATTAHLTITQAGIYNIQWPGGGILGSATRTRVLMCVNTTVAQEVIYELDDVYRTMG